MLKKIFTITTLTFFSLMASANPDTFPPQLSPDLVPGTIAWAFPDQLHPSQPETGKLDKLQKFEDFEKLFKESDKFHFPDKLYAKLSEDSISPVIISKTPAWDPRSENPATQSLGYILDRTHTSAALSMVYKKSFGNHGLSEPISDHKGRPINFILVRVVDNLSSKAMTEHEFEKYMIDHQYCYLKKFILKVDGSTEILDLPFSALPRTAISTDDNPFRSLVWVLEQKGIISKNGVDFDEFRIAEVFVKENIVRWPELMHGPKSKSYRKAIEKAKDFLKSDQGRRLLGPASTLIQSCKDLF